MRSADRRDPEDDTDDAVDSWLPEEEGNTQPLAVDGPVARREEVPEGVDHR